MFAATTRLVRPREEGVEDEAEVRSTVDPSDEQPNEA